MRIVIGLFTLLLVNSCTVVKENDKYGIQFFIKSVYNDSDVVKSGSLLSEPFQVRNNKLPSLIILKLIDSFYSHQNPSEIEQYLSEGLKLIMYEDFKDDIEKLENEKIITIDSINFQPDKKINYLGYLTIFQVFINSTKTKVYIYYSTMDATKKMYRSFISENHLLNGKK